MSLDLNKIRKSKNVATLLSKDKLHEIAAQVIKGCQIDEDSRKEWKDIVSKALEIAKQVMKDKTWPWPKASNIKFPLITQACIDYASRTLPDIIQTDKVVKANIVGSDPDGKKYDRGSRVSTFMSHQLMVKSPDWVEGTDSLLQILPVMGTVFKKTYYSEVEQRIISEVCVPDKIVVNYGTKSLDTATRITHIIGLTANDIRERQLKKVFIEKDDKDEFIDPYMLEGSFDDACNGDEDRKLEFYEQCCYLDLDEDGYKEPYIVTVHKSSQTVFRIVHRFKNIEYSRKKATRIVAEQVYTDFHFIKSLDGGFYSMGFGALLLPLNKAINSLINQLIDSGTLNNTQGGLYSNALRLKQGTIKFKMGEWQCVPAGGEELAKNIYPWPTKEPSQTLYQLLGLLMQIGRDLSSTTDVLMGKQPVQNVATNTVNQMIEQGTKTFVAINKRVQRSFKKEYQRIYYLNSLHLTQKEYSKVMDDPEALVSIDFNLEDMDIVPVADPTVSTETQRMVRAQVVQQLRTANPREADKLMLEAMQLDKETINRLLPPIDPNAPPPPEQQKIMAETQKLQADVAQLAAAATLEAERNSMEKAKVEAFLKDTDARVTEASARIWKMQEDALHNRVKDEITKNKMLSEQDRKGVEVSHKMDINQSKVMIDANKVISNKALKEQEIAANLEMHRIDSEAKKAKENDSK